MLRSWQAAGPRRKNAKITNHPLETASKTREQFLEKTRFFDHGR